MQLRGRSVVLDAAEAGADSDEGGKGAKIRFFFSKKKRYWRREGDEILKLVLAYSRVEFSGPVGRQAEMLFSAAMPKAGFLPVAEEAREYAGRRWERTQHDLDRIYEKDGAAFGVEIKNQLAYIEAEEFEIKLQMCRFLGLRPVFIARMMPKSYIYEVHKNWGGFCLIFKHQLYPFGQEAFAKRVRAALGLPVDCPRAIAEGTIVRLAKWHEWYGVGGPLKPVDTCGECTAKPPLNGSNPFAASTFRFQKCLIRPAISDHCAAWLRRAA